MLDSHVFDEVISTEVEFGVESVIVEFGVVCDLFNFKVEKKEIYLNWLSVENIKSV